MLLLLFDQLTPEECLISRCSMILWSAISCFLLWWFVSRFSSCKYVIIWFNAMRSHTFEAAGSSDTGRLLLLFRDLLPSKAEQPLSPSSDLEKHWDDIREQFTISVRAGKILGRASFVTAIETSGCLVWWERFHHLRTSPHDTCWKKNSSSVAGTTPSGAMDGARTGRSCSAAMDFDAPETLEPTDAKNALKSSARVFSSFEYTGCVTSSRDYYFPYNISREISEIWLVYSITISA